MASAPPKKNTAFVFYCSLPSRANSAIMQANPTLAAGDVKVAVDDAAPANITTLPTVDADFTKRIKVSLSAAEMNGDNTTVIFSDAAGDEWCDVTANIQTSVQQIDDLATPTNITAGTITTVTNLTNAPTAGDLTATMKTSVTTAATAATPTAAAVTGAVGSVTGNVGGNVVGSVGSVTGLTASNLDATISSRATPAQVATELATYDAPTNTEMVAAFAEIKGATWAATDTLEAIRDRGDSAWVTATGFSTHAAADVWTVATRVLTANTNLNDPTAAAIADAVWDEAQAGHVAAGSFGEVATEVAAILVDTAEIGAAGAGLTALATQASVNDLPTNAELATALGTADDAVLAQVALVKAKTDSLTFTVAGQVDSNIQYVNDTQIDGSGADADPWGPI